MSPSLDKVDVRQEKPNIFVAMVVKEMLRTEVQGVRAGRMIPCQTRPVDSKRGEGFPRQWVLSANDACLVLTNVFAEGRMVGLETVSAAGNGRRPHHRLQCFQSSSQRGLPCLAFL